VTNTTETSQEPSVDVIDLRIALTHSGVDVVDEIGVKIRPGEVLGLVGESGSGKTTVGMALLGHVRRGGEVAGGVIRIDGRDLSSLGERDLRRLRGGVVSYIPQDPGTSLNPALRISTQLEEILEAHATDGGAEQRKARVREALAEVALPSDERGNDVVLAFPQIIFVLLAVSAIGPKLWLIVVTVGITHAPRVARVIRGAAQQIVERDFIKADEVAGERRSRIIMGGLLPNVTSPLLVELGLRMTFSIGLIAAISFLGFGLQPPAADWGLMINENRLSITVMPWGVLLPVLAIAVLTVGTNLITDGIARAAIGLDRTNE